MDRLRKAIFILLVLLALQSGCGTRPSEPLAGAGDRLKVVATTTIVGDVVRQVAGDKAEVSVLLPAGVDPHSFEPAPQDLARVSDAGLIFANGAGLEEFLTRMIANSGTRAQIVEVSEGIQLLEAQEPQAGEHPGAAHTGDPHTWFDPNNVKAWAENIARALGAADPGNAAAYMANAQAYEQELDDLDGWIRQQVDSIPPAARRLVTDHASFTYFAARYGFEQVGTLIPGYSTLAAPSAQELAALEDAVRGQEVKAIFVGREVNPALAQRVAQDTGIQLVFLYNGSLTGPDGPASTYLDFMRYDVTAIVEVLAPGN